MSGPCCHGCTARESHTWQTRTRWNIPSSCWCKGAMWHNPWQYKACPTWAKLAQWVELQLPVFRLVPSGVIGLTEEPKSGFPKSFQAPPVVVSTPHCRQKEKGLAHSVLWACTVGKKKKACTVGYFIWSVFYWRPSKNPAPQVPHRAYGCPDHVECDRPLPVLGVHG